MTTAPKLHSLPPTNEASVQNVKRSHFQTYIWKFVTCREPPPLHPTWDVYAKVESLTALTPTIVSDDVHYFPGTPERGHGEQAPPAFWLGSRGSKSVIYRRALTFFYQRLTWHLLKPGNIIF